MSDEHDFVIVDKEEVDTTNEQLEKVAGLQQLLEKHGFGEQEQQELLGDVVKGFIPRSEE